MSTILSTLIGSAIGLTVGTLTGTSDSFNGFLEDKFGRAYPLAGCGIAVIIAASISSVLVHMLGLL